MLILLGATFGAEVLAEFAFALGRTARGVFSRPVAATTITVVMVVDLVFAFSTRDELVVVVFVRAILVVLAALVVRMLGFRAMHVARFLRLSFRVCLVGSLITARRQVDVLAVARGRHQFHRQFLFLRRRDKRIRR